MGNDKISENRLVPGSTTARVWWAMLGLQSYSGGFDPHISEIMEAAKITSSSVVRYHLDRLVDLKLVITHERHGARLSYRAIQMSTKQAKQYADDHGDPNGQG